MNIFVFEYITSGALCDEHLPASLASEGDKMLLALLDDLKQLSDIQLVLLRDHRLEPIDFIIQHPQHLCQTIHDLAEFEQYYTATLNKADAVFIIAPETGGLLYDLQQSVLATDTLLLGCQPKATQICSDKLHCYQHLKQYNITSVTTVLASTWSGKDFVTDTGYIVKPRDGAGCIDTLFFAHNDDLNTWLGNQTQLDQLVIQPYISGLNLSLNLLYSVDDVLLLSINQQSIEKKEGQLHLTACTVNGVDPLQLSVQRAQQLAQQLQLAIAGLWGFVGVDIIVTDDTIFLIDINPRLTTSYIGLHRSLSTNPCELLFSMLPLNTHSGFNTLPTLSRHAVEVLI